MDWIVPGTVITGPREQADLVQQQISSMFLAGGIVLSQVSRISGLSSYTVQNWVKRGFLSPPVNKRYTKRQLCRVLTINTLKSALPMEKICSLLGYINGQLNDESDDLIDDSVLYFMFVSLASRVDELGNHENLDYAMKEVLADYEEPVAGARERVEKVLRIMLTAWVAACMRARAEAMMEQL